MVSHALTEGLGLQSLVKDSNEQYWHQRDFSSCGQRLGLINLTVSLITAEIIGLCQRSGSFSNWGQVLWDLEMPSNAGKSPLSHLPILWERPFLCLSHPAFGPKPRVLLLFRANLRAPPVSCVGRWKMSGLGPYDKPVKAPLGSFAQFARKSRGSPIIRMLMALILPQRPLRLSSAVFIPFPLFCSSAVISTILSSVSLILCSALVILLLVPSVFNFSNWVIHLCLFFTSSMSLIVDCFLYFLHSVS